MGTAMAPESAIPRSETVHSTRVPARMETISPFLTPSETSPQAVSSLSRASCVQETSCHRPATLRRAAVRCASVPARWRKSCATDWMLASSLRCFCIALTWLSAVAIEDLLLRRVGRSVRIDPVAGLFLHPPILGRVVAERRGDHLLDKLRSLVDLVSVGVAVGEVDLRAEIVRVGADRFGEDLRRLPDVALRPGQLEEVASPDHLRRSVEVVLVDAQRGEDPVAKLAFEPLRERGDDPDSLRIEPDADGAVVLAPHLRRIAAHSPAGAVPRLLSQPRFPAGALPAGFPVAEGRRARVRLEGPRP